MPDINEKQTKTSSKNKFIDWILRFVKGMFIGSGFILPGVSGGALAAVFGIYERIISFLANITKKFKENVLFFLPVGLGALLGVFLLAFPVDYFLGNYMTFAAWFFIGCIVGTVPALWKQAGQKGRSTKHIVIMVVTFIVSFAFLFILDTRMEEIGYQGLPQNFGTWILSGALIGLGVIVPGLSPSNLLLFLGMYQPMTEGIKNLDFSVIIPLAIGGIGCVLLLAKLVELILEKAYAGMFHFILGIVFASTVIIVPSPKVLNYLSISIIPVILLLAVGILLGWWMSRLEENHTTDVKVDTN